MTVEGRKYSVQSISSKTIPVNLTSFSGNRIWAHFTLREGKVNEGILIIQNRYAYGIPSGTPSWNI